MFHNFINKRRDKRSQHMRRVLEKVVSENIEPWNVDNSCLPLRRKEPHFLARR